MKVLDFLLGWFFFLVLRVSSWLCSVPMWLTLILHFAVGLPIGWFWATLAAWLMAGLLRYLLICFARWGANSPAPESGTVPDSGARVVMHNGGASDAEKRSTYEEGIR